MWYACFQYKQEYSEWDGDSSRMIITLVGERSHRNQPYRVENGMDWIGRLIKGNAAFWME